MVYIQFYQLSTGYPSFKDEDKYPIEVCGDRGVIILDGRNSPSAWHEIAKQEGNKRGFVGYTIHKGESFTRSNVVHGFTAI